MAPEDVSQVIRYNYPFETYITTAVNLTQLGECTESIAPPITETVTILAPLASPLTQLVTITTKRVLLQPNSCKPVLLVHKQAAELQPEWANCALGGAFDPPIVLTPQPGLTPTQAPLPEPAVTPPTPTPTPDKSTPDPDPSPTAMPVLDPDPTPTPTPTPPKDDPVSTPKNDPTTPPENDPPKNPTSNKPAESPTLDPPNQQVPSTPKPDRDPPNQQSPSTSKPENKPPTQSPSTPGDPSNQQPPAEDQPPKLVFTSTKTPSSKRPQPIVIASQTVSQLPSNQGVVVGSQTIVAGGGPVTVGGQEVSIASSGVIVVDSSRVTLNPRPTHAPAPAPAPAPVLPGSQSFVLTAVPVVPTILGQNGGKAIYTPAIVFGGTTLKAGDAPVTIKGTRVSLGNSALVVGTVTKKFAEETPKSTSKPVQNGQAVESTSQAGTNGLAAGIGSLILKGFGDGSSSTENPISAATPSSNSSVIIQTGMAATVSPAQQLILAIVISTLSLFVL